MFVVGFTQYDSLSYSGSAHVVVQVLFDYAHDCMDIYICGRPCLLSPSISSLHCLYVMFGVGGRGLVACVGGW